MRKEMRIRKLGLPLVAVLILAVALPALVAAQPAEEAIAAAEEYFRLLPVRDGWLLEPLDQDLGIRTIEVGAEDLAIDGQAVSEDELRARLGELAGVVSALRIERSSGDALGAAAVAAVAAQAAEDAALAAEEVAEIVEDAREEAREARQEARERAREKRAERRERMHRDRSDSQIVVGNSLTVEDDEVYRDIVVFGGRLTVDGQVIGDAVAIGGSAEVSGEITGDLAVVGGSIELEEGARIMGDVVSVGGSIEQAEGVEIGGQVSEVSFAPNFNFGNFSNWGNWTNWTRGGDHGRAARHMDGGFRWFGFFEAGWQLMGVLFCALLACLVFLVARNPVERIAWKVSDEPWKSGLVGLLTQILCLPILVLVCLLLAISIIGIPLLLLVPFAILGFILVAFLGYTAVAYRLGSWSEERFSWNFGNPYFSLLVGVGVIEVCALIGEFLSFGPGPIKFFAVMFGLFGCLVIYVAWTIGLGGAMLTRFGTWDNWRGPSSDRGSLVAAASAPSERAEQAESVVPPPPDWDEPPVDGSINEPDES